MEKSSTPPHLSASHSHDSEREDDDHDFDLHDYDLDVVDNVLNNPHQTEYYDHFGFKIEVKTDDEDSDGSSDGDSDDEQLNDCDLSGEFPLHEQEQKPTRNEKGHVPEFDTTKHHHHQQDTSNSRRRFSNCSSNIEKSASSSTTSASDEDEYSVDTALTTPTTHKHHHLSTSSLELQTKTNEVISHTSASTDSPTGTTYPSRLPHHDTQVYDVDNIPIRNSQSSNYSSYNMNSTTTPPSRTRFTSATGTAPVINTFQRPSQAFRERQTKRMSELSHIMSPIRSISDATSPPRTSTSTLSKRLSSSSTMSNGTTSGTSSNSYYGMLKAKFKRSSQESEEGERETPNQIKLRQDTLKLLDQERKTQPAEFDWDFWKSMIIDVDKVITTQGLALKHHISMGIPDKLRGSLWQLIAKSRNQPGDVEANYWELLKRTSPHEKLIQHDLDTSFPMAKFFPFSNDKHSQQSQSLFHVLKAYSLFDQDVGYSQGLSFIVAILLQQIADEVAVFCLLIQLMGRYGLQGHLTDSMDTLQLLLYQFDHLFQFSLPELHRHVDAMGIKPDMYASHWFATSFAYHCSPSLAVHVLDLLLVEGAYVLQRFALALLKRNQDRMMVLGFEALLKFLQVGIFDVYNDHQNEFVIDMYLIEISHKLYTRLAKQYKNETARMIKQRTEDDEIRHANEQLTIRIQDLQDKYRVLEMEHQEMTRQAVETKMSMAKMDADNEQLTHQLKQLKTQFEHMERQKDTEHQQRLEDIYRNNAQLIKRNASLQDQISDMEGVLIGLKMNFAERESEYQVLRRQLLDARKS